MLKVKHISFLLLFSASCIETFQFETGSTKQAVVIEANLTDEVKSHLITISYSNSLDSAALDPFALDTTLLEPISGATVWVEDQNGLRTNFNAQAAGRYFSNANFKAEQGSTYTLNIELPNGDKYQSDPETLMPVATLDSVYQRFVETPSKENEGFTKGIQIFADAQAPQGNDGWFRYEWEDAYEFRAPFISKFEHSLEKFDVPPETLFSFKPRKDTVHICYKIRQSRSQILGTTQGLTGSKITEVPIRFLDEDVIFPIDQYGIQLRQYSISSDAYQFYKQLEENNLGSGTFFDKQKGDVFGNIRAISSNKAVLGYFELASVQEKKVAFSPEDFSNRFDPVYPLGDDMCKLGCGPSIPNCRILDTVRVDSVMRNVIIWLPRSCADCSFFALTDRPELLAELFE